MENPESGGLIHQLRLSMSDFNKRVTMAANFEDLETMLMGKQWK